MLSGSVIHSDTIQAYLESDYTVDGPSPFTLRINIVSAELLGTHKMYRTNCSAYITACNPFSEMFDTAMNEQRQNALRLQLRQRSLKFLEGVGRHPSAEWPPEPSALVLGITLEAAKTLGAKFQQNAIIWAARDGKPQLILLR